MNVLVIAAHPDDEVLGCGATLARHADAGDAVHIALLTGGVPQGSPEESKFDAARRAAKILGAADISFARFAANRLDTVPFADIVQHAEAVVKGVAPKVVYVHASSDLHVDHVIAARAALTATRPHVGSPVEEVYAFATPASGDWQLDPAARRFEPNTFVDVERTIDRKLRALEAYGVERAPADPRSPGALRALAARWGSVAGIAAAEAFALVRATRKGRA